MMQKSADDVNAICNKAFAALDERNAHIYYTA